MAERLKLIVHFSILFDVGYYTRRRRLENDKEEVGLQR